ncbi:MAG: OstA-like protein [Rikenellaceae bacterium]
MRKIFSFILTLLILGSIFAQGGKRQTQSEPAPQKELIDIKADVAYPYKVNADSSVLCLVGNFAAQHNGAVITADSAVRYGDERIACFGNVLINKNTTYAYADRADYDGTINQITLYSHIIKVIDEDVTLYTYNFKFNTLDNIGEYYGGGIAINGDSSRLESIRGYYYADTKDVVGVEDVEIYTKEYDLRGDSVKYNMENDYAEFYQNTNIWNSKGEYLYANEGNYDRELARFFVTRDGYILTTEQEVWSDSLEYFPNLEEAILRGNIQMDDTAQKVLIYSDFAHYWGKIDKIFLTRNPSVVNYDPEQGDTTFMRADTIIVTTHNREDDRRSTELEALRAAERATLDSLNLAQQQSEGLEEGSHDDHQHGGLLGGGDRGGSRPSRRDNNRNGGDHDHNHDHDYDHNHNMEGEEGAAILPDSLMGGGVDSLIQDSVKILIPKELKALAKDSIRMQKAEEKRLVAERASLARIKARNEKLDAQKVRAARLAQQRRDKMESRMRKQGRSEEEIIERLGYLKSSDSLDIVAPKDTLDSLALDSLLTDSLAIDSVTLIDRDSIYRILVAYRNARTYKPSMQSVSDSLSGDSRDTTLHLYKDPYIWNGNSQVSSEYMDIYTQNGELTHAIFTGRPITASMIDTAYYNQVTGRVMTSYFVNNELMRNDVEGNVQTIYFAQDNQTEEVTTMVYVESGSASFYFEASELMGITYRAKPEYIFYPVELIPESQSLRLEGFRWRGNIRPKRSDFSDRQRRESVRSQKEALELPQYPIATNLMIDIENLTRDRIWMDRGDLVAPHAEEWLESLGYKSGQPRTQSPL